MLIKNKNQMILLAANILLVFFLILLSNLHVLPLRTGDFVFFSVLILFFALYRPGWGFLFFVGTIPLKNINLAPFESGIMLRPYQFFGAITILALLIRLVFKKLNFHLIKPAWHDLLIIILGAAGFLSAFFSANKGASLKQSVILASFIFLYFLARNYIQTTDDIKKIIPFFLSSSAVVMLYGIWQNVRFAHTLSNFEVMPGRPNATFTEADWYGIYLSLCLVVVYVLIFYFNNKKDDSIKDAPISNFQFPISKQFSINKFQIFQIILHLLLILTYVSLILTVSRSAWLSALAVTFIYLFILLTGLSRRARNWRWKLFLKKSLCIIGAAAISLGIVYVFHLTNFQLFNRAQSTGSGLQKITISCKENVALPQQIQSVNELDKFSCRHINLEEINAEKASGNFVTEIYRRDPNINIRNGTYKKSWEQVMAHPILGIGWGSISAVLGTDERGVALNASNIFLEVWLGSGIVGLASFLVFLVYILLRGARNYMQTGAEANTLGIFGILGFFALVIPNLFNAGIMLGFLWLFLAVAVIDNENK